MEKQNNSLQNPHLRGKAVIGNIIHIQRQDSIQIGKLGAIKPGE
jgi:hypothetical protein